jgi:hypothetical protein
MGKRERRGRVEGAFIPLTQKRAVTALRPRIFEKTPKTLGSLETSGKTQKLWPPKVSTQKG